MDTNQVNNEEVIFSIEEIKDARFLLTTAETKKIKFNFGSHEKNGYMKISHVSGENLVFDVFDCDISGDLSQTPRQIEINKEIVERDLCEILKETTLSKEEMSEFLCDFVAEELYFDVIGGMPRTYAEVLKQSENILFENEASNFIKDLTIEGNGCLYVDGHPQSLIEAICFHSLNNERENFCLLSLDLYQELHEEGNRFLVFFPYGKQSGYRLENLAVATNSTGNFKSKFNQLTLSTTTTPEIINRDDYPAFKKKIQKINNNNFLDLYIEDPYEQREELFQKLCEEAS